jgi:hypothetical protein
VAGQTSHPFQTGRDDHAGGVMSRLEVACYPAGSHWRWCHATPRSNGSAGSSHQTRPDLARPPLSRWAPYRAAVLPSFIECRSRCTAGTTGLKIGSLPERYAAGSRTPCTPSRLAGARAAVPPPAGRSMGVTRRS